MFALRQREFWKPARRSASLAPTGCQQLMPELSLSINALRAKNSSRHSTQVPTGWAREAVISTLVSDVAAAYFQLRELDLQLEISRRTLVSRRDSLRLTQMLANGGATSMLDVRQAEQLVFTAAETIPDLER